MAQSNANDNAFNYDITVRAINELLYLLKGEVDAVKNDKVSELPSVFNRKVDVIRYLEAQNAVLSSSLDSGSILTTEQKEGLRTLIENLQLVITENNKELEKAKYFNDQIIRSVINTISEQAFLSEKIESATCKLNAKAVSSVYPEFRF